MKRSSQKGISKFPKVPAKNILCLKNKSKPVNERGVLPVRRLFVNWQSKADVEKRRTLLLRLPSGKRKPVLKLVIMQ